MPKDGDKARLTRGPQHGTSTKKTEEAADVLFSDVPVPAIVNTLLTLHRGYRSKRLPAAHRPPSRERYVQEVLP